MHEWITTFKNGRISVADEEQPLHPSISSTEENGERVLAAILDKIFDGWLSMMLRIIRVWVMVLLMEFSMTSLGMIKVVWDEFQNNS
jgi:hypothetical protein